jgi:hypothetical protein
MSTERRKHKIITTGDSHGRDCASTMKYDLDNTFEVQGVIQPGADLMAITKNGKRRS